MRREFDLFINEEKAREFGIRLDDIINPHDIWNRDLPEGVAYVFWADEDSERYRELDSDPEFTKKRIYSGN